MSVRKGKKQSGQSLQNTNRLWDLGGDKNIRLNEKVFFYACHSGSDNVRRMRTGKR